MKVAITGGTGFIGRGLTRALIARGDRPVVLSRSPQQKCVEGAEYRVIDFNNSASLAKGLEGCDAVVHLAAALFCRSRHEYEKANTLGTANLAAAAAALPQPPKRFVYVSSLAAGGPSENPDKARSEADPEAPVSFYGMTKLEGERELKKKLEGKCSWTVLRPPIVYGKHDAGISKIADWVRKGFMINAGAGHSRFSFVYLDDLVRAILTAMGKPELSGGTFYVCEKRNYEWNTFIRLLAQAMGVKMPVMIDLPPTLMHALGCTYEAVSYLLGKEPVFNRDKSKEGAAGSWIADPSAWGKAAGWEDWTPLEEGIKRTFSGETASKRI